MIVCSLIIFLKLYSYFIRISIICIFNQFNNSCIIVFY